jgi:pimeloyl-ACP methyl ester carboxylesterase
VFPTRDGWRHGRIGTNGIDLHRVTVDPEAVSDGGTDPPVVLLHGFPECWYTWHRQLPALAAAGRRTVALDLRGYNRSDRPDGVRSYRLPTLVDDVAGAIDALGGEAAVVGHDWGGVIAWRLAAVYPDRVSRLVVLNAPHPGTFRREVLRPRQFLRSWYALAFQVPGAARLLETSGRAWLDRVFDSPAYDATDVDRYAEMLAEPGALAAGLNYYRALRYDAVALAHDPGRISVPARVVWGTADRALSPSLLDGLSEWVSDLRVDRLDASHWVHAERPDAVNEALRTFLGRS